MEILFELQVEKLLLGSQRQFSTQRQIEGVITGVLSALWKPCYGLAFAKVVACHGVLQLEMQMEILIDRTSIETQRWCTVSIKESAP